MVKGFSYNFHMNAKDLLDDRFLEMRWRCLSLAADLDRIERAEGGKAALDSDVRLATLRRAVSVLLEGNTNRAEQVQLLFSDKSPAPARNPKSAIRNPQ